MTWNYRIIYRDDLPNPTYGIHEVFYDEDNVVETYTEDPVDVCGDTPEEAMLQLAQMTLDCLSQPVLKASELKANIEAWEAKSEEEKKTASAPMELEEFIKSPGEEGE